MKKKQEKFERLQATQNQLIKKMALMGTVAGLGVECDPDEADRLGAFVEDAMTLEDAIDASGD